MNVTAVCELQFCELEVIADAMTARRERTRDAELAAWDARARLECARVALSRHHDGLVRWREPVEPPPPECSL